MVREIDFHTIAGAVALALIEGYRRDAFCGLQGFPQITVSPYINNLYEVKLGWFDAAKNMNIATCFSLTKEQAMDAAKIFKGNSTFDHNIVTKVHDAMDELQLKHANQIFRPRCE